MTYEQNSPFDAHFHGRHPDEEAFGFVKDLAGIFDGAVFMPNLDRRPIVSASDVDWYWRAIMHKAQEAGNHVFHAVVAIKASHELTADAFDRAITEGASAIKGYPVDPRTGEGMTTNAGGGVYDFRRPEIQELYRVAIERSVPFLFHGEAVDMDMPEADREWAFRPTLEWVVEHFPTMRIVFEHISDRRMIEVIKGMPDHVAATVTLHHLVNTVEDNRNPHNQCMPTAKTAADRDVLREVAMSGNPKFFFGSDHAPHPRATKEVAAGTKPRSGVCTAPVMMPLLIDLFERHGALDRLEDFTSTFGKRFYRTGTPTRRIRFERDTWCAPEEIYGVVPFMAGQDMPWKFTGRI